MRAIWKGRLLRDGHHPGQAVHGDRARMSASGCCAGSTMRRSRRSASAPRAARSSHGRSSRAATRSARKRSSTSRPRRSRPPSRSRTTVEIGDFVEAAEIDPVYFEKSDFLEPTEVGAKPFSLLKRALEETDRVALARVTIRTRAPCDAPHVRGHADPRNHVLARRDPLDRRARPSGGRRGEGAGRRSSRWPEAPSPASPTGSTPTPTPTRIARPSKSSSNRRCAARPAMRNGASPSRRSST